MISREAHERALQLLIAECEPFGSITLGRFRDFAGISRKLAQLLVERFDSGSDAPRRRGARAQAGARG